jgi:hypothetical protein
MRWFSTPGTATRQRGRAPTDDAFLRAQWRLALTRQRSTAPPSQPRPRRLFTRLYLLARQPSWRAPRSSLCAQEHFRPTHDVAIVPRPLVSFPRTLISCTRPFCAYPLSQTIVDCPARPVALACAVFPSPLPSPTGAHPSCATTCASSYPWARLCRPLARVCVILARSTTSFSHANPPPRAR